jgi:hypothetical protein
MKLAPIALFVYNRPVHTRKTIEFLLDNNLSSQSNLYIFSDAPKREEDKSKVAAVRKYIHSIKGFNEIHINEREKNLGLAKSIVSGVTEVVDKYGSVIVLEDDLVTSPEFLTYMNCLLNKYEDEKDVFCVTGYNHSPSLMQIPENYPYDVYFNPRPCSWGWGVWKDKWDKADWDVSDFNRFIKDKDLQNKFNYSGEDKSEMLMKQMRGEIDSWAIRWDYTLFKNDAFCVYPVKSYIDNIGNDSTGVHCGKSTRFSQSDLNRLDYPKLPPNIEINPEIMNNFRKVYSKNIIQKLLGKSVKRTFLYGYYRKIRYQK